MKNFIEYAYQHDNAMEYSPHLLSIDPLDISSITSVNQYLSLLTTKTKEKYFIFGKIRNVNNRLSLVDGPSLKNIKNINIRPSLNLTYNLNKLGIDSIIYDASQLKGILDSFFLSEGYNQTQVKQAYLDLMEDTFEQINNLPPDFWKIPDLHK
jgi:hypothetical protein